MRLEDGARGCVKPEKRHLPEGTVKSSDWLLVRLSADWRIYKACWEDKLQVQKKQLNHLKWISEAKGCCDWLLHHQPSPPSPVLQQRHSVTVLPNKHIDGPL